MVALKLMKDGKKFMWDGREYPDRSSAEEQMNKYGTEDFETVLHEEGGKHFIYTRRVVTEIELDGEAPL